MAWTNSTKDWSYQMPFHRINSPSWHPGKARASGKGYDRGCHAPSDGPDDSVYGLIIRQLARAIPGWVAVEDETEQEAEGSLDRCFQTWTDVPLYQWHRFFDWNFHLAPTPPFSFLKGLGNVEKLDDVREFNPVGQRPVTASNTMECEWDCGAFGTSPGPMFDSPQWLWPMTGQYCWIAGRWIYDCGHASSDDKTGTNAGTMRTELHPVKAVASAQWEAVQFPENGNLYVPGIRFQFFASRLGGYKPFAALNTADYEFIVDLPKNKGVTVDWRIGHTPDFPLNTAVLRAPHLLHRFDYITTAKGTHGVVEPTLEPIPAENPGDLPQQVKVKIPLTKLGSNVDYYGVIVNLGWYDPDQSQARKVKRCSVKFNRIHKGDEDHDTFAEDWIVKFGVNGRWFNRHFTGVHNDTDLQLNVPEQPIFLGEDDSLYITAHGADVEPVGAFFDNSVKDRTLRLNGVTQTWDGDIAGLPAGPSQHLWDLCYEAADMLFWTFNKQNKPLGMIDPLRGLVKDSQDRGARGDNPLPVKTLSITNSPHSQVAYFTADDPRSAELEEDSNRIDYTLFYEVTVQPQLV
jgi:hypothetical protein